MKVLQFINSLTAGGAEKLLIDAVLKYHEKGLKVDVLLINAGESPFVSRLKIYPEISIFSLGNTINVYNPKFIFQLNKFFKQYDVIHVHLFPALYYAAVAKIISPKKYKLVFTEHNSTNKRRNSVFFKLSDKLMYSQFDKVVTISDAVDLNLRRHLGNSFKRIEKIYNGINLQEITDAAPYSKTALGFTEKNILLIQVSSFTPQKDQATLIRAIVDLPKEVLLLLIGDGQLKEGLIQLTKDLSIQNRVFFLGIRKDVPRLLKSVDCVVLSSHFEGLSLSSVEGLASGKPFIASDVPGLTEVVQGAGLLFPDQNSEILKEMLLKIMNDPEYYTIVAKQCLARSKEFDIELMTDSYIKLYRECL